MESVKVVAGTIVGLTLLCAAGASAHSTSGTVIALVTAEQQNELIALDLKPGKVLRRVALPADPQNVAVGRDTVVVVSTKAHAVTLLDRKTLRVLKVLRAFAAPHIVVVGPGGDLAYVTDDTRGMLSTIDLKTRRVTDLLVVGVGAHHMAIGPGGRRAWIALGEHARAITIVSLANPRAPTPVRRFSPGFVAHDLTFGPAGNRVWVTSGVGDSVHVLDARTGKSAFTVPVGASPQHVVFSGNGSAFVTSGYSRRLVKVDPRNGRVVASARTPYGSFNLSAMGGVVVTTSLLNGQVAEFTGNLRRISSVRAAPAARAVALTVW